MSVNIIRPLTLPSFNDSFGGLVTSEPPRRRPVFLNNGVTTFDFPWVVHVSLSVYGIFWRHGVFLATGPSLSNDEWNITTIAPAGRVVCFGAEALTAIHNKTLDPVTAYWMTEFLPGTSFTYVTNPGKPYICLDRLDFLWV